MLDVPSLAPVESVDGEAVIRKVTRRLVPFLVACFFSAYLDRVNVGFAALTMNKELGFSPEFFGWGAGVFFLGYCLFEAPSNYILHRVGARIWIARIMASWGLVSALTACVWDGPSFLALRMLLGVAEAGFAPGAIFYLTTWIPAERRTFALGAFLLAVPLSSAAGAPVSGLLLAAMDGVAGVSGWRWLFILEALPSILLGGVAFFFLTDRPADATWLAPAERAWLRQRLAEERAALEEPHNPWGALGDRRVLALGLVYFGIVAALYGVGFWLPQIAQSLGFGIVAAGFVTSLPYVCGVAAMIFWSRRSDAGGQHGRNTAFAAGLAALGLAAAALAQTPAAAMLALSVASIGTLAAMPTFWSLSTGFLTGAGAAIGVAAINSLGNVAGFAGPYLVGWIKGATGEFSLALLALALAPLASAALALRARTASKRG